MEIAFNVQALPIKGMRELNALNTLSLKLTARDSYERLLSSAEPLPVLKWSFPIRIVRSVHNILADYISTCTVLR